jgi:hypothetical protein
MGQKITQAWDREEKVSATLAPLHCLLHCQLNMQEQTLAEKKKYSR